MPLLLTKLGVDPIEPRAMAEQLGSRVPRAMGQSQQVTPSERMQIVFRQAVEAANELGDSLSEHRTPLPRHAHAAPRRRAGAVGDAVRPDAGARAGRRSRRCAAASMWTARTRKGSISRSKSTGAT